jgi:hypothetical protein
MRYLAIGALAVAILFCVSAKAEIMECDISVDGELVLDGPCHFRADNNRLLFLSLDSEQAGEPAEITVLITRAILTGNRGDHGRLYRGVLPHPEAWLTRRQADNSYKKEWIGRVEARDACWINDRVRICVTESRQSQ